MFLIKENILQFSDKYCIAILIYSEVNSTNSREKMTCNLITSLNRTIMCRLSSIKEIDDLGHSGKIWGLILLTQIQSYDIRMQAPFRWSWSTLLQVNKNQKSYIVNIFSHPSSRCKMDGRNSILLKCTSLDIQILDQIISSWYKHLKTLTH